MNMTQSIGITAIGAYAPPAMLTNFDLEKIVDTSDEWIRTRTGISTRHITDAQTSTSDLAMEAGRIALQRAALPPEEVDLVIVATVTPDYLIPATSCVVQHKLNAMNAAVFDVSAACTGFIYALNVAYSMIASGGYRNALVIGADALSKVTDYTDRSTCILLGDGAGAVVLQAVPEDRGFRSFYLRADGSGVELLTIPAGGSRKPTTEETVRAREHFIRMNGNEIFKFAVRVMEEAVATALDRAGLTKEDVKLIVPHQANIRIIDAAAKRLGIPADRWGINIREYGNTSAASIPIALNEAFEHGRVQHGDVVVLVGFGGGLTWGASVVRW